MTLAEKVNALRLSDDYLSTGRRLFPDKDRRYIWRVATGRRYGAYAEGLLGLTRQDVRNIWRLYSNGKRVGAISQRLGVDARTVQHVINGHPLWQGVDLTDVTYQFDGEYITGCGIKTPAIYNSTTGKIHTYLYVFEDKKGVLVKTHEIGNAK